MIIVFLVAVTPSSVVVVKCLVIADSLSLRRRCNHGFVVTHTTRLTVQLCYGPGSNKIGALSFAKRSGSTGAKDNLKGKPAASSPAEPTTVIPIRIGGKRKYEPDTEPEHEKHVVYLRRLQDAQTAPPPHTTKKMIITPIVVDVTGALPHVDPDPHHCRGLATTAESQVTRSPVNDKNTMSRGVRQCKRGQEFVEAHPASGSPSLRRCRARSATTPQNQRAKYRVHSSLCADIHRRQRQSRWWQQREDDQDCGGDAKTIKNHGSNNDEDNQDAHGGGGDDAKTITAAATTAKTIKTAMATPTRRRSRTTARRREDDHSGGDDDDNQVGDSDAETIKSHGGGGNDNEDNQDDHGGSDDDAKTITAAATTAKSIKSAIATRRRSRATAAAATTRSQSRWWRRREDNHGGGDDDQDGGGVGDSGSDEGGGWEGDVDGIDTVLYFVYPYPHCSNTKPLTNPSTLKNPYPNPSKPVPARTGTGFPGYGYG
ncbi:hypothetical protein EDB85DRAFT_1893254 [Lactarius pseudohatsudake]|nr:hypothetical protein EDB85DRAFT_1893254 [Lactarius pseudohatsudake]